MGSTGVTCEAKSWDSAMMELKKLMQIIHKHNMEFHGVIKKSKEAVDLGDIKSVHAPSAPASICTPIPLDPDVETMPNTPVGDGPNFERALTTHFEAARRRASVSRFYTDVGPRKEWDAPLSKFVKVSGLRNRRRDQKAAMSKLDSFTPVQSLIAENDYKERLSQVQMMARRNSGSNSPINESRRPSYLDVAKGKSSAPKASPRNKPFKTPDLPPYASFIDHLHAMKKAGGPADDTSGPFDFRSILKKSDFAPTDSLRRRKGSSNRPIPRIIKSQASSDQVQAVTVTYDEDN